MGSFCSSKKLIESVCEDLKENKTQKEKNDPPQSIPNPLQKEKEEYPDICNETNDETILFSNEANIFTLFIANNEYKEHSTITKDTTNEIFNIFKEKTNYGIPNENKFKIENFKRENIMKQFNEYTSDIKKILEKIDEVGSAHRENFLIIFFHGVTFWNDTTEDIHFLPGDYATAEKFSDDECESELIGRTNFFTLKCFLSKFNRFDILKKFKLFFLVDGFCLNEMPVPLDDFERPDVIVTLSKSVIKQKSNFSNESFVSNVCTEMFKDGKFNLIESCKRLTKRQYVVCAKLQRNYVVYTDVVYKYPKNGEFNVKDEEESYKYIEDAVYQRDV